MDPVLRVENLSKKFGKRLVLNNVSFSIAKGEIVGFVGPNGAGKTTVMKCCMGLLKQLSGEILICGKSVRTQFEQAVANISYMSDSAIFYDYLSGYDNLKMYAKLYGTYDPAKLEEIIRYVGMEDRMHDPVKSYSLGMKQRMSLVLAVLNEPMIVLMDEPMNGLDPEGVILLRDFITQLAAEKKIAFFISSHNLNELDKVCERIITIQNGVIQNELNRDSEQRAVFALSTGDLQKTKEIISKSFQVKVQEKAEELVFEIKKEHFNQLMRELVLRDIEIRSLKTLNILEAEYLELFGGKK